MMAATVGPDIPVDPASTASVVPETRAVSGAEAMDGLDISGPNHHPTPRSNPPPNPPFVFPAKPTSASSSSPPYSRATGRRPKSFAESMHLGTSVTSPEVERRQSRSPVLPEFSFSPGARSPALSVPDQGTKITSAGARSPALPDFKFNPGVGLSPPSEHPFLSPPQSPQSPRPTPIRATGLGHRRGGSEFVGGQIRSGDAITVLGTSPTKSESGFASPQLKPANPRRGHAHRRSAALSSHDLSVILKPASPQLRGSSAPSSPAAFDRAENFSFPNSSEQLGDPSQESVTPKSEGNKKDETPGSETTCREEEANVTPRPSNRARVGFSDTLEFIPRPLSLVSSDTSSTVTARPGHSLSGSISSVISLPSSVTAPEAEANVAIPNSSRKATDVRPSTAGAILERSQSPIAEENKPSPQRRNSIPLLNASALTAPVGPDAPSPSKAPKRWSFFGLEPFVVSTSPTRGTRPPSSGSADSLPKQGRVSSSSDEREGDAKAATDTDQEAPQKHGPSRVGKKKKRVTTWAGSILTRRSKHRQGKKRRQSQTPPPANVEVDDEDSLDGADEAASVTNTPVLAVMESPRSANDDEDPWLPGPLAPEEEVPYPMIDLDAALGPFNTPLPRNAEWEAAQRASGLSKRPLHSAARLSGFSGPGMHYQHRRAESAPEMPPFNRAGIPRFNSNSTMADVFEEDEEDDAKGVDVAKAVASSASVRDDASTKEGLSAASIDIRVTDSSHTSASNAVDGPSEDDTVSSSVLSGKGSGLSCLSDDDRTQPSSYVKSEYSASSLHDEIIAEESRDENWRVADCRYPPSGNTSDSATPSPRRAFKGKELAPVEVSPLHLPTPSLAPVSPYSISQSSAFPSPRSPMSYDGNRISTAPSSFTEDNFQSLLMGEPGPEVRISMDMPSLTSSNSTMTRESAFAQTVQQLSQAPARGERPASFSSPFGRRGSLASIGRLISTSHGERSKLSAEVSLDSEPVKKPKPNKAKRLSRMIQFWKPKDAKGASTT